MIDYIFKFIIIIFIVLPFYLLIRRPWKHPDKREAVLAIFTLFTIALLALAFEGTYGTPSVMLRSASKRIVEGKSMNFIPFKTIGAFFKHFVPDVFMVNIVGNIVMFMPWGFGLALLWKKNQSVVRIVSLSFLFTLFIEAGQLFIGRSVDVDDLILNFSGGCLGALLYLFVKKRFPVLEEFASYS